LKLQNITVLIAIATLSFTALAGEEDTFLKARMQMVGQQIEGRGVKNPAVVKAMRTVPRHLFVPKNLRSAAYADEPLPIGFGQTISQPYIVAYMTELLDLTGREKVLEIGTGSGYQAAVLAETCAEVYSIEIIPQLYAQAEKRLENLGYDRIRLKAADGYYGWPDKAPFDAIIVTCAAAHIPPPLLKQLKPGGRMVIPVGPPLFVQNLILVEKDLEGKVKTKSMLAVRFVPLVHEE
jgi:protein-L-isoaspartate(D-aspartate) O-methyltransferase